MADTLKKYGVWIAAGALVLYLALRQARGGAARPLIASTPGGIGGEQYRLESERLKQSGMLDIERLRINAQLEAERIRQTQRQFDVNAQLEAARRARETQERGQTLGLIGQIAKSISDLFKGQQTQSRPGPSTPSTFPGGSTNPGRTQPQLPPAYVIPEPSIGNVFYDPQYVPDWPAPPTDYPLSVTDWGEPPQFSSGGMDVDTGASFYDQFYGLGAGDDFSYGYGYDQPSYDIYSDLPTVSDYVDYGGGGGGSMDDLYDYYEDFGAWGGEYAA